jgi:hypothetical protein
VANDLPSPDGHPTADSVEIDLIDALTYEDDKWLWEPVRTLNNKYPYIRTTEKVGLARQVVLRLAEQKRVTLWRGQWPSGISGPLSKADRERIAVEDSPWSDPEGTDLLVIIQLAQNPV